MYSYKPKGKWLECNICNHSYREILQSDVDNYFNIDGSKFIINENDSTKCYYCNPLILYFLNNCNKCNINELREFTYGNSTNSCNCSQTNKSPAIIQSQPKMDGGAKELFNRIKKRNYGSTMPDY